MSLPPYVVAGPRPPLAPSRPPPPLPTPPRGGRAFFIGVMAALVLSLPIDQPIALVREPRYVVLAVPYRPLGSPLIGLLLGALAITALGAVDDLRALPGRLKFPLIYAAASVPVWFGMTTPFLTNPFDGSVVPLGLAGAALPVR